MQSLSDISAYFAALLFAGSFFAAAVVDAHCMLIPDACHVGLLLSGIIRIVSGAVAFPDALAGLVMIGGSVLALSFWRDGLGGGDVKLIGAASFAIGILPGMYALMLSLVMAILYLLIRRRVQPQKGEKLALAPFLAVGYCWIYLFG